MTKPESLSNVGVCLHYAQAYAALASAVQESRAGRWTRTSAPEELRRHTHSAAIAGPHELARQREGDQANTSARSPCTCSLLLHTSMQRLFTWLLGARGRADKSHKNCEYKQSALLLLLQLLSHEEHETVSVHGTVLLQVHLTRCDKAKARKAQSIGQAYCSRCGADAPCKTRDMNNAV